MHPRPRALLLVLAVALSLTARAPGPLTAAASAVTESQEAQARPRTQPPDQPAAPAQKRPDTSPPAQQTPSAPAPPASQAKPREQAPDARRSAPPPESSQPKRAQPRPAAPPQSSGAQGRQAVPRREPPRRADISPRYRTRPHAYYFPPVDTRLGFYYHPYFGFYYGPYYGPFYPYPGPDFGPARYSTAALRTRVKPVETEVYVNGYYAGIVDDFDGVFQRLYVPSGMHRIELRLSGYRSFHQDIYAGPGDTFEINHQMLRLRPGEVNAPLPAPRALPPEWTEPGEDDDSAQPASPYGMLAIQVKPDDAQILVDGEAWAAIRGIPELVVHLPAGWHQLEVRKQGYQTFSTKIELTEGHTTRLSVTLAR
jgi:hypothetical protein